MEIANRHMAVAAAPAAGPGWAKVEDKRADPFQDQAYQDALRAIADRQRARQQAHRQRLLETLAPVHAFAERRREAGELAAVSLCTQDPDRPHLKMQAQLSPFGLPSEISVCCEHDSYERREALLVTAGHECAVFFSHEGHAPILDHLGDLLDKFKAVSTY